jgi:hypothetical protein
MAVTPNAARYIIVFDVVIFILPISSTQEAYQKSMEDEYCAKHQYLPVIIPKCTLSNNLFSAAIASRTGQSPDDPYDMTSDDKEKIMIETWLKHHPGKVIALHCNCQPQGSIQIHDLESPRA